MKILLSILFVLIFTSNVFAKNVIYYNATNNKEIIDVSGEKTIEDIKKEFGDGSYQVLEVEESEGYKIDTDVLRKYTNKEKKDIKDKKDKKGNDKKAAKNKLKNLGLTQDELDALFN